MKKIILLTTVMMLALTGCESPYERQVRQAESLVKIEESHYSLSVKGFDEGVNNTVMYPYDAWSMNQEQLEQIQKEHAVTNMYNGKYFKIKFNIEKNDYESHQGRFKVKLTSLEPSNLVSEIKDINGNYFNFVPNSRLYRKEGYSSPSYFEFNYLALNLLGKYSPEVSKKMKSHGYSHFNNWNSITTDLHALSFSSFNMDHPRDIEYINDNHIYISMKKDAATELFKGKDGSELNSVTLNAYLLPVIIFVSKELKEYSFIYNPQENVIITDESNTILKFN